MTYTIYFTDNSQKWYSMYDVNNTVTWYYANISKSSLSFISISQFLATVHETKKMHKTVRVLRHRYDYYVMVPSTSNIWHLSCYNGFKWVYILINAIFGISLSGYNSLLYCSKIQKSNVIK